MKRRKHATYVCLGAGCLNRVRMRVPAKTGPKPKPPMWKMVWARAQEGDSGILREIALQFCSQRCLDQPAQSGDLAVSVHTYLGASGLPPATVTYRCVAPECDLVAVMVNPKHRPHQPDLPEGWDPVPLLAVDYESGIHRITTLPTCSEACLDKLDPEVPREKQPELVQRELARVLAGMHISEEDAVMA